MLNLDQHIATLLEDHDCVIVPDFGGFVANYAKAKVNPINHRFDPPHRRITFNKLLVHNDGLLAAYVAKKENERYEEALKSVKQYSLFLSKRLKEEGRVDIQKVGILMMQEDGTYRFEQVKNPSFFKDGFGLESFFSQTVDRATTAPSRIEPKSERKSAIVEAESDHPKREEEQKIQPSEPVKKKLEPKPKEDAPKVIALKETPEEPVASHDKRRRNWIPAAAAALLAPIIGYGIWVAMATPIFKDQSQFHVSDLNPFSKKVCPIYSTRVMTNLSTYDESEGVVIEENGEYMTLSLTNAPDKTLVVRLTELKRNIQRGTLKYHIIGGCFSIESNAHGLVSRYRQRGSNSAIIDKRGNLLRVSIASFATKKEAEQALASFQKDIPGAWLLYK